jgi:hypothetical protein
MPHPYPDHRERYNHEQAAAETKATAPDYTEIPLLQSTPLEKLLARRQAWSASKKAAEEELRKYDDRIGAMLAKAGVEVVRCNDHTIKLHTTSTYTVLTEDALLRNGVSPATIAASRELKTKRPYLQIYAPRGSKGSGSEAPE